MQVIIYAIFVSIKHMLCNYKQFQENKLDFPFWDDERVMGSSYNTEEASLSGCSSPPAVEVWF